MAGWARWCCISHWKKRIDRIPFGGASDSALSAFFFLLIKESALIIFALCVLLLLASAWRQGVLTRGRFLKIVIPSGLVVLVAYGGISWLAGGPEKVLQTYRHMNDGLQTNDYVYLYQSGPWYAIPLGFWVLSPVSTFLGLTAVLLVLLRGKMFEEEPGIGPSQSLAPTGLALFVVAALAAATFPAGLQVFAGIRISVVLDGHSLFARGSPYSFTRSKSQPGNSLLRNCGLLWALCCRRALKSSASGRFLAVPARICQRRAGRSRGR